MIKIDSGSNDPLYKQVKDALLAQINAGIYTPDQPIPTERELATSLNLSRLTVRRSMTELTQMGLIRRIRGRGTYITSGVAKSSLTNIALVVAREDESIAIEGFTVHLLNGLLNAAPPAALGIRKQPVEMSDARDSQGLVVLWEQDPEKMKLLIATGVPIVGYECTPEVSGPNYDTINHANESGAFEAVMSLINLGHRDIGYVMHQSTIARERQAGYERALRKHNIPIVPERIYHTTASGEAGYSLGRQLLEDPHKAPTALFCSDDNIALGVLSAVQELGLQIPQFMSIIGFGDIGLYSTPVLSSVRMNIQTSGLDAVRLLKERAANPALSPRHLMLPTEYIRRASCGPRRANG